MLPISMHAFFLSEESSEKSHKKLYIWLIISSVILVILGIILAPIIIDNLFPKFSEGINALQIIIITLIPMSIASILQAKLQATESTKIGLGTPIRIGTFLSLIAILGTNFELIGLSLAMLFSSIIYVIVLWIIFRIEKKSER